MSLQKVWTDMPPVAKTVTVVVVLGTSAMVGFTIYNKLKREAALKKEKQSGKEVDKEIEDAIKSGKPGPTLSKAQLGIMADQLKVSFGTVITDNSTVYRTLYQVKNDADVLMLIKVYGLRVIPAPVPLMADFKGTLPEAIAKYMPQSSFFDKSINDINEMLAKKKITLKF